MRWWLWTMICALRRCQPMSGSCMNSRVVQSRKNMPIERIKIICENEGRGSRERLRGAETFACSGVRIAVAKAVIRS